MSLFQLQLNLPIVRDIIRFMAHWKGSIAIAEILRKNNSWKRYIAWKQGRVRQAVYFHVARMLACRTPQLGAHLFLCPNCDTVMVVPHSCKSVFCSSCGKVRTDQWCKELLSDILDVPYRHLVFTLPWEIRLLIQDNRRVLLGVLFRAAADALLSLTAGRILPKGRKSCKWLRGRKRPKPYTPGVIIVLHTFGSDIKWNPHVHVIITAGGLGLDGQRWISAPKRYLVPAPLLGTEWKLNVIAGVRKAHENNALFRRRLRKDRRRRIDIDKLLGHIRKKRWHILIGPSLKSADKAVRYACRYTKRPVIAEGRIVQFKHGYVTFKFKDYHKGGCRSFKKLPVLVFIDRLVQHLPEKNFRQLRHYGLFSTARRTECLVKARQFLAQRKNRRPKPMSWEQRRKAAGNRKPLSCPRCGHPMELWCLVFGLPRYIAQVMGLKPDERIPPKTLLIRERVLSEALAA
jgi:hypothetical protein